MRRRRREQGSHQQLSITLAGLASDGNFEAGRQSTEVVLASSRYTDMVLQGRITLGSSPTGPRMIEIWLVPHQSALGTWPTPFGGTDAAVTVPRNVLSACGRMVSLITTDGVTDRTYFIFPTALSALCGGVLPLRFVLFVVHNTGVALNASESTHALYLTPIWEILE